MYNFGRTAKFVQCMATKFGWGIFAPPKKVLEVEELT